MREMITLRIWGSMIVLTLLLGACRPEDAPALPTGTARPSPSTTFTSSPTASSTQTPKTTPQRPTVTAAPSETTGPPTPSITPAPDTGFDEHPLALNPGNVVSDMVRLARIGRGTLYDVAWSPDGAYLAVSTGVGVYFYDAETLEELRLIDVNEPSTVIDFSPDSRLIAVARKTRVGVWSVETGLKVAQMEGEIAGGIWALDFGGGGRIAAIGQISRGLGTAVPQTKIWDSTNGETIESIDEILSNSTYANAFNPDGSILVNPGTDWAGALGLTNISASPADAFFSPDGNALILSRSLLHDPTSVLKIDLQSREAQPLPALTNCLRLEQNGQSAICYGIDIVHVFDPFTGVVETGLFFPTEIENASVSPSGSRVAIASDGNLSVIDTGTGSEIWSERFPEFDHVALGIVELEGPSYRYAAAHGNPQGEITVYYLGSTEISRTLTSEDGEITGLAFSPDRRTLASLGSNGIIRLWDLARGEITYSFDFSDFAEGGLLRFSPDGLSLAFKPSDREGVLTIPLETGGYENSGVTGSAYLYYSNPPFQYLNDGSLMVWDFTILAEFFSIFNLTTDQEWRIPYPIENDPDFIDWVAVNPFGNRIAAGIASGPVFVWELDNLSDRMQLSGHLAQTGEGFGASIIYLEFAPYNNLLLSVGWDETIRLWNIETGNFIRLFNLCCYAGFSPDGRLLVTAGDGVIRVWGIPPWP